MCFTTAQTSLISVYLLVVAISYLFGGILSGYNFLQIMYVSTSPFCYCITIQLATDVKLLKNCVHTITSSYLYLKSFFTSYQFGSFQEDQITVTNQLTIILFTEKTLEVKLQSVQAEVYRCLQGLLCMHPAGITYIIKHH